MLGGIPGEHRELLTEGPYGAFEQAVERRLGKLIRKSPVGTGWHTDKGKKPSSAQRFWSALANVIWVHPKHGEVSYSFRAAGDLIAAIRQEGNYLHWYCCGPYAVVAPFIEKELGKEGWTFKFYEHHI